MTFITGIIAFGTFFIELNYVMGSLWKHQIYFLAFFLWISLILLITGSLEERQEIVAKVVAAMNK